MARPSGAAPGGLFAGRYRVERELGRGGMAVVYLAHDTRNSRPVALKVLRRELAAVIGPERFLREIEVAASLNHPNILPLYDSDQIGDDLHFVMPYVESGTLADRLSRGPRLTVDEALAIARQTAAGLSYAHARGIVHRDIKPANLLLSGGNVFITDFGVARAVRQAATTGQDLTESGLSVGTPAYMAPEQVRGASLVDGRADEYSLAAVLHEMLVGEPPHAGSHRRGVVHRALQQAGRQVPPGLERALVRALAVDPDERFTSMADFAEALDQAGPGLFTELRRAFRRADRRDWAVVGGVVILLGLLLRWVGPGGSGTARPVPDTTHYAVLPFEDPAHLGPDGVDLAQTLRTALLRWGDVIPADPVRVREAVAQQGGGRLGSGEAMAVSRAVGAGRYIRGSIEMAGDSLRIHAALYQLLPDGDSLVAEHTVGIGREETGPRAASEVLADWLLFRGPPPAGGAAAMGTASLAAWQEYQRGMTAIHDWQLDTADVALARAAASDPAFARASLWLAVVRTWRGDDPARWRYAVERAASGSRRLGRHEAMMTQALLEMADGRYERACPHWRELTRAAPDDFAAWYGTGQCEATDSAVVPDPRSPSGWRFRSSYHSALAAYRRAFALLPSLLGTFRGDAYASARTLLYTRGTRRRMGRALPPDTLSFLAEPAWRGDSLSMVPYPAGHQTSIRPEARALAILRQRELLRDLAQTWVAALPQSADARITLALAMEFLGDPAALDTVRRARALVRTDAERVHQMGSECWMRVRLALAGDSAALAIPVVQADSLLATYATRIDPPEPALLSSLAMLRGRPSLSARLLRREAAAAGWTIPAAVGLPGVGLLAFAAAGGPADSLRRLVREVEDAIARTLPASRREGAALEWVGRPLTLAFPAIELPVPDRLIGRGDWLLDVLDAYRRHDTSGVTGPLARVQARRSDATILTFDTLLPEAWVLAAIGLDSAAIGPLDRSLAAAGNVAPPGVELTVHAGSLIRAMALRAELAARHGDRVTARHWAGIVERLWRDGEPAVRPVLRRMAPLLQ